jgi:6-phosphogluconolactonase
MTNEVRRMSRLFIGTYTEHMPHVRGEADGILVASMDAAGRPALRHSITGPRNPSFVAISPDGRRLYCVQETTFGDDPRVHGFALDENGNTAGSLGSAPARGGEPCHISLDPKGRFAFVANYGTGSVAAFPLDTDGRIIDQPTVIQHEGSGPNPRQEGPHMHAVLPDAAGEHIIVCDLGTDSVTTYRLTDDGIDASGKVSAFASPPGSGPRQLAFSPDGKLLFMITEFAATVDSFAYNAGALTHVDRTSLLPESWRGENYAAAIAIHPTGRFGYGSNRGQDSVAIFSISETGALKTIGWQQDGVEFPRDIAITPDGKFLLVANQNRQTITTHRIDPETGMLTLAGDEVLVPSPSSLAFAG